jgi:plastocyanin
MRPRGAVSSGLLAVAVCACACGGLSHPLSNDGSDGNSALGANPGTSVLLLTANRTSLALGDTETLGGTYAGATLINNGTFTATSSDSSVVAVGGIYLQALSVGSATITGSYQGSQASIGFTVLPVDGLSAIVGVRATSPPTWVPSAVKVVVGSAIQFNVGTTHSVVFDAVPGAPPNISVGAVGAQTVRLFPAAGAFTYQCTIHGESGVVNVTPAP